MWPWRISSPHYTFLNLSVVDETNGKLHSLLVYVRSLIYILMYENQIVSIPKVWRHDISHSQINHQSECHGYYLDSEVCCKQRPWPWNNYFLKGITNNDVSKALRLSSSAWILAKEMAMNHPWAASVWFKSHSISTFHKH